MGGASETPTACWGRERIGSSSAAAALARIAVPRLDRSRRSNSFSKHILPKTERLTEGWIAMLGNGDPNCAAVIREQRAHRLGNLTLSAYNANLGKMDFLRKRDRKNNRGDYIGYRNGLYLKVASSADTRFFRRVSFSCTPE